MQLMLPSSVNFQVTPRDVNYDSLVRKMYQPKRTLMYPQSPYSARALLKSYTRPQLEGLGFSYYDLLNEAGLQNCDPRNEACVAGNQQIQAAVEDLWVNRYESNAETSNQATPHITVTPNETPAAVQQFLENLPDNQATIQVAGGPVYTVPQLETRPASSAPVATPPKPNQSVPPTTPLTPMSTGFQNTAAAIIQQQAAGQEGGQKIQNSTLPTCPFWQMASKTFPGPCDTNTTLVV